MQPTFIQRYKCNHDNYPVYYDLLQFYSKNNFNTEILGNLGGTNDILLLTSKNYDNRKPSILFTAGIHGEEPAPVWGIIYFLEKYLKSLNNYVNISFIPILNITGFLNRTRENMWGENPNRGCCHNIALNTKPSKEIEIVRSNIEKLMPLCKDCFSSLHENIDYTDFYLFTYERTQNPSNFTQMLLDTERLFFKQHPDVIIQEGLLKDGYIYNKCDGSFEDLMFHKGSNRACCTETPGKLKIDLRIQANAKIIDNICRFFI